VFLAGSGTSTLRKHLSSHKIAAPKWCQKTMYDYHMDPHPKNEQKKLDVLVANWIVCDIQPFNVVEYDYVKNGDT
jgi:hypothetical protein